MKFKSAVFLLYFVSQFAGAQNNAPTIKVYKKVFTTYPFSDPDPIPKPDTKVYPYYRFDGFTDKPIQKEWKVIELENDFIKLTILPEVGGKVWSAIEKSTGKDFVYNNHVVKFRDIAMRGPWTSGGVEGNYGIVGHTPNCATPVDYITITREDGSVSCVIGVLDLLTRTSWKLDINLPKDKAYFTTNSFWFNDTAFEQPYYTWMNTGIKAAGNLQFIYPGKNYLGHDGEYNSWPINKDNGKDLSFYNNNNFGGYKSYHVFGKYSDFFGGYWHDEDFGMARYGNHDDKPGKKIWIWGLSQQGMIWDKLLTDTDGQYVEVQSGRLFNQSSENSMYTPFKHRSFSPYQSDSWTEYWFPVKQTKGFVKANNYGSVNVKSEDGWLKIYFSPLQNLNEKLEVLDNGKPVYSRNISVKPMELFKDSIRIAVDENKLKLIIGENKLVWNSAPEDGNLSRPLEIPKDFDNNSVYGLYLQGKNWISFKDYIKAEEKLTECLQKDPNYAPALSDMAFLQMRKFQYTEAVVTASKALAINTYDPAANYYYALANLHLGNSTDAKDGFDIAASSVEYRTAAYTELGKLYFCENEPIKAIEYAEKSLLNNQQNLEGLQLLAVLYRLQNNVPKATEVLNRINAVDPLNHFVRFEKFLSDGSEASKQGFTSLIQNEMPQQTYLELGIWYQNLNRKNDALKAFSLAVPNAELLYWKAFLENKAVDLSQIQPGISFPFRAETANVLEKLIPTNNQWQLKYHLALIEWNRNNLAKAKELFQQCGSKPMDPAFYAARAALMKDNPKLALIDLQQAIKLDKQGWRYSKLLTEHFIVQKQYDKALTIIEPFYKKHTDNYIMGMLYAKTLLLNKKYASADALLTQLKILPFEGATAGRQLYHEAKLMQAVMEMKKKQYKKALQFIAEAKLWPENLGAGKPYDENIDERMENWLNYLCYTSLDDKATATESLEKIIAFSPKVDNTVMNFLPANQLVSAWAIEKTSNAKKAEEWLQAQASLYPSNKIIQWCLQTYTKKKTVSLTEDEKDGEVRILEQL
ncbi:Beta-barrel assembly-enhancing protease [compost metagenome]